MSIFATLSRFSTFAPCCLLYLSHGSGTGTQGCVFVRESIAGAWSAAAGAVSLVRSVCYMKRFLMCRSNTALESPEGHTNTARCHLVPSGQVGTSTTIPALLSRVNGAADAVLAASLCFELGRLLGCHFTDTAISLAEGNSRSMQHLSQVHSR